MRPTAKSLLVRIRGTSGISPPPRMPDLSHTNLPAISTPQVVMISTATKIASRMTIHSSQDNGHLQHSSWK